MKLAVMFTLERETKNTIRYAEVVPPDTEPIVGTLYVQKKALNERMDGNWPIALEVTIEVK